MSDANNNDERKVPLPTFSGGEIPMHVCVDHDDSAGVVEITRRTDVAPSFFPYEVSRKTEVAPSFDHHEVIRRTDVAPSFDPHSFKTFAHSTGPSINPTTSSSISTRPQKPSTTYNTPAPRTPSSNWNLTDAVVLPEFHPLERTAVFVPYTSPAPVASRISAVLQQRSIQARYEDCKASCVTPDNVHFRVFLYRGQKDYSHGIIVEVQRRFGNSLNFFQDTQAILDAASGKDVEPPSKKRKIIIPLVEDEDHEEVSSSSLDFVSKMLSHSGHDAQYLALQTLSSLTDSDKMGSKTAVGVAKVLMNPGNEVGSKVLDIAMSSNTSKQGIMDGFGMRLMATTILSNVVTALKGDVSPTLTSLLRPVLMENLQNAKRNPQIAYLSAKCLVHLNVLSSSENHDFYSVLRGAQIVGEEVHANLATQAKACIQRM